MARYNAPLFAFNRGRVSKLMLARTDIERLALSAEIQTNCMSRKLGAMSLRPGWEKVGSTYNDAKAFHLPFIFSLDDTAIIEITDELMRVRIDEEIVTRVSVGTTITNGTFAGNITGWNDNDQAGATSAYAAGDYMSLMGNGKNYAIRSQQVSVGGGDENKEHALRIVVTKGEVRLRVGTSDGLDDYINETVLAPGTHSLAFTPIGTFYVRLFASTVYSSLVKSVAIEAAGDMTIPAPWAEDDMRMIRQDQSADVLFVAADKYDSDGIGYQQYKIERRGTHSWSVVQYLTNDGPFQADNIGPVSISSSALSGDVTITASQDLFYTTQIGSLIRMTSVGQNTSNDLAGEGQFGDYVRVTGLSQDDAGQRIITINITGLTGTGNTVTLQRSVTTPDSWVDVNSYTTNQTNLTYDDEMDNQIVFYRLGIKTGNYSSGTTTVAMSYASGGITGIARINGFTDDKNVSAYVLVPFGATTGTTQWALGQWSDRMGYPTATRLNEARLEWFGRDRFLASVVDAFSSFDDTIEGDSGPINRSIGSGPVDRINWAVSLDRLAVGGELAEHFIFSGSLEEPLSPTSWNIRTPSVQGSAAVDALKVDRNVFFVQRCGTRIFSVAYDNIYQQYPNEEITILCPEIGEPGIIKLALQIQPDIRIHALRSDGTVGVFVYDKIQETKCWLDVETDGEVEDIIIMPGQTEDKVYYSVKRTIDGDTKRFLERWALESECKGGTTIYDGASTLTVSDLSYADGTVVTARDEDGDKIGNYTVTDGAITFGVAQTYAEITPSIYKLADSFVEYDGVATTTIPVAHLEGEEVIVFADGKDFSPDDTDGVQTTYTVTGGQITLAEQVEKAIVGLPYRGRYKSTKLAFAAQGGTALLQKKNVNHVGVILSDTHVAGLKYGRDFDHLENLPRTFDSKDVSANHVFQSYDQNTVSLAGTWDTDSRLCFQMQAPRPCCLLGAVVGIELNEDV